MNIGLDFHGVVDSGLISKELILALASDPNIKIFILTGSSLVNGKLLKELEKIYGLIFWDGIYSIEDYLLERSEQYEIDPNGNKLFKREKWNSVKAILAEQLKLDFHIDDSEEYEPFFVNKDIPFILIKKERNADGVCVE